MDDYKPISNKLLPKSLRRKLPKSRTTKNKIVSVLSSLTSNRIQNNLPYWNKLETDGWYFLPAAKNAGGIPVTREILFFTNPNSDKPKPKRESCTRYACQRQEKRDKREAFPTATFPRPYCSRR